MEFCSNCGAIMIPYKDILECSSCEYSNQICPKCGEEMNLQEGKCTSCDYTNEICPVCGEEMDSKKGKCTSCDYSNENCPKCGEKMNPKEGILKCNSCGNLKNLSEKDTSYKVSKTIEEHENVKMLGEDVDMRSTIKETCPECGHDEAYYELKQTRSADEAPTRIFTCAKCKHTWRAYH